MALAAKRVCKSERKLPLAYCQLLVSLGGDDFASLVEAAGLARLL